MNLSWKSNIELDAAADENGRLKEDLTSVRQELEAVCHHRNILRETIDQVCGVFVSRSTIIYFLFCLDYVHSVCVF